MEERFKMIEANISPDEINGYPDFFHNQCIFILHNNGIGPDLAHELLRDEKYYITEDTANFLDWNEFHSFAMGVPFFYFYEAQSTGKSMPAIISEYNETELKKEFGKEAIKRFKKQMYVRSFDQCRYEVYAEVVRNFLDPKHNADKPLALCSLPSTRADKDHFFCNNPAPLLLNNTRLLITQANENRLAELIVRLGLEQGLDASGKPKGIPLWVDCGHGYQDSIDKAMPKKERPLRDRHVLDVTDHDFVNAISPYITGEVILFSCSTAKGHEEASKDPREADTIYALWLKENLPRVRTLYAASESIHILYGIKPGNFKPTWDAALATLKNN